MEFLSLLIAIAAIVTALLSHSRITDLKLQIKRLRRDFENMQRLNQASQPLRARETAPVKAAALKSAQPQKSQDLKAWPAQASLITPTPPTKAQAAAKSKTSANAKKPRKSFEEALGAQWSVWVGGLALFLGAVFLLRYSIEAGVFTPAMRVIMASVLGIALLVASEWLRRIDQGGETPFHLAGKLGPKRSEKSPEKNDATDDAPQDVKVARSLVLETAYIPGILAAAGIFALLGAAYTSYALYDFITPTPAFILLGLLSLGAIALSLRHGPILAALGLAASLVTPLLVQTEVPSVYLLYGYLIIVAAAAISAARMRQWGWLTLVTLASLLGWSLLSSDAAESPSTLPVWYGFLGLSFLANIWLASRAPSTKPALAEFARAKTAPKGLSDWAHGPMTAIAWGGIAALLIITVLTAASSSFDSAFSRLDYTMGLCGAVGFFAASYVMRPQKEHVFSGAAVGAIAIWTAASSGFDLTLLIATGLLVSAAVIFLTTRPIFAAAKDETAPRPNPAFALFAAAFPLIIFVIMDMLVPDMSGKLAAAIILGFAVVNGAIAYLLRGKAGLTDHASVFAIGAGIVYVIAAFYAFDGLPLTFALLGGLVIAALAAWKLGDTLLRIFVPAFAGLSAAHSLLLQLPSADSLSERIIINELWIYFALPATLCAGAAWVLGKRRTDLWSEGLKALALAFAALFVVFQIRHIMNGGQIYASRLSFDELALQVLTGLCFTLGGAKVGQQKIDIKGKLDENLIPALMTGLSMLSLFAFALGVCLVKAPLFNGDEVINGNFALNSLTLGYLVPAIILAAIGVMGQNKRPEWYIRAVFAAAAISVVMFVTSMIRYGFVGRDISLPTSLPAGLELYAISAAWLALGIGALIAGMKMGRQDVRLASAALITLTVLKAFLIDMASLEGVLRAMSFVVLGLVLIVIGRVYQKVLLRP